MVCFIFLYFFEGLFLLLLIDTTSSSTTQLLQAWLPCIEPGPCGGRHWTLETRTIQRFVEGIFKPQAMIMGNQWLIVPDHKADYFLGG